MKAIHIVVAAVLALHGSTIGAQLWTDDLPQDFKDTYKGQVKGPPKATAFDSTQHLHPTIPAQLMPSDAEVVNAAIAGLIACLGSDPPPMIGTPPEPHPWAGAGQELADYLSQGKLAKEGNHHLYTAPWQHVRAATYRSAAEGFLGINIQGMNRNPMKLMGTLLHEWYHSKNDGSNDNHPEAQQGSAATLCTIAGCLEANGASKESIAEGIAGQNSSALKDAIDGGQSTYTCITCASVNSTCADCPKSDEVEPECAEGAGAEVPAVPKSIGSGGGGSAPPAPTFVDALQRPLYGQTFWSTQVYPGYMVEVLSTPALPPSLFAVGPRVRVLAWNEQSPDSPLLMEYTLSVPHDSVTTALGAIDDVLLVFARSDDETQAYLWEPGDLFDSGDDYLIEIPTPAGDALGTVLQASYMEPNGASSTGLTGLLTDTGLWALTPDYTFTHFASNRLIPNAASVRQVRVARADGIPQAPRLNGSLPGVIFQAGIATDPVLMFALSENPASDYPVVDLSESQWILIDDNGDLVADSGLLAQGLP